ncbi:hypothetical protein [Tumebacillus permanentifrigoris]|uniref:Uncharacterized protein n=1 Tax=Tumebacillus permanentifrigoris TaxID=378543 RepID=A0A316D494_9BACL|nr:hypothetical protein [Tumebacillus permanentifrigoris]PWK05008.1 hypothetical protein C7459_1296 [Tumebacillus permanentifrigoris]
MESTTRNLLFLSVAIILFLTALTTGYSLFTNVSQALDQTYETNQGLDRNQSLTLKVPSQDDRVSGSVVLQSIYQIPSSKVDIYVDGVPYLQSNFDIDALVVTQIDPGRKFAPAYVRDHSGVLTSVRYTTLP